MEAQRIALGFFAIRPSASSLAGGRVAKKALPVRDRASFRYQASVSLSTVPPGGEEIAQAASAAQRNLVYAAGELRCRSEAMKSRMA